MGTFIPYADPTIASATLSAPNGQYPSIAPYANTATGITDAYNNTSGQYQIPALLAADAYGSGGGTSASGAGSGASINSGVIDQLNGQLGQLDQQQGVGLNNLQNSYQTSLNSLDQQNQLAGNQYNTQKQQNTQSYLNNRNNIIANTNSQANALQRLLGINGAGNSSAAYEQAPYAAGLQGTQNLNQAQTTYGNNGANLQNAYDQTEQQYGTGKDNLNQQLYAGQNSLKSSIAQTRANILSQLATAQNSPTAYTGQINDLLNQITQLGSQYANPVLSAPNLSYNPATLANYSLGAQSSGNSAANPGTSDVNPTFLGLLGQQRDQYGNLVTS